MHAEAESDGALPLAEPDVTPAQRPYSKTAETGKPPVQITQQTCDVAVPLNRHKKRAEIEIGEPPVQTTQQTCDVAVPLNRHNRRDKIETDEPPYKKIGGNRRKDWSFCSEILA